MFKENKKNQPVVRVSNLNKAYLANTPQQVEVLKNLNFELLAGELTALTGPSGSGKSTLLNILGLLDQPTSGELYLQGQATSQLNDEQLTQLRGKHLGFVFQFHHLIGAFSVLENVLMPLQLQTGKASKAQTELGLHLLNEVGLAHLAKRSAKQLSGGQQQRVALARALINEPSLLLADEPTGNLDSQTADEIFNLLVKFNQQTNCALLLVTHDPKLSALCPNQLSLFDGKLV